MSRTILVADDSPTHQRRANGILTGEGLDVVTVSNGVAAIKKLPSVKPALVLADVSMPGRDGYEVCEFVKNSSELAHIPVLLIFSDLEPYDEVRARRVGADGRVKKPFSQDELVAVVNQYMAKVEEPLAPTRPVITEALPEMVREPADLPPEFPVLAKLPDWGELSENVALAEPTLEEVSALPPEAAPLPMTVGEISLAPEGLMDQEVTSVASPGTESPADVDLRATEPAELAEAAAPAAPPEEPALPAPVAEIPAPAEPILVEEALEPAAPEPLRGSADSTMAFRMPVQIAEPILSDDLPPTASAIEAPPSQAEVAPAAGVDLTEAGQEVMAGPEIPAPVEAAPPLPPTEITPLAEGVEPVTKAWFEPELPAPVEAAPPPPVMEITPPAETVEPVTKAWFEPETPAPVEAAPTLPGMEIAPPAEAVEPVTTGWFEPETPAPVEAAPPPLAVEEAPPVAALDLSEAAAGTALPEAVAPLETPSPAAPVEEAPSPEAPPFGDAELVRWVVHNVVVRMAPPALPTAAIEDLIRQISDDVIAELTQPPPEPQD